MEAPPGCCCALGLAPRFKGPPLALRILQYLPTTGQVSGLLVFRRRPRLDASWTVMRGIVSSGSRIFVRPPPVLPLHGNISRRWRSAESNTLKQPATAVLNPRWLSDLKHRIGTCLTFGCTAEQTRQAGQILSTISRDWRELTAGSEGYLTSPQRCSIYRRLVIWGEMDQMGRISAMLIPDSACSQR